VSSAEGVEQRVADALLSRRTAVLWWGIHRASYLGIAGEALLVEALPSIKGPSRVILVSCLGDMQGPDGVHALREVVDTRGPGTVDSRCVALIALAKRLETDATPDLIEGLRDRNSDVRRYALVCLAWAGDSRAWVPELEWLRSWLRAGRHAREENPLVDVLAYLLRNEDGRDQRLEDVVDVLRSRWLALPADALAWLDAEWPDLSPESGVVEVVAPPRSKVDGWLRHSFFRRSGVIPSVEDLGDFAPGDRSSRRPR
jgi:hypothetical protein